MVNVSVLSLISPTVMISRTRNILFKEHGIKDISKMKKDHYRRTTTNYVDVYQSMSEWYLADTWSDIGKISMLGSPATPRRSFNIREMSTNYISKSAIYEKHHFDIVLIMAMLCWTVITVDTKRYKYDAIPLRARYQPSISDICIGKSETKNPIL